MKLKQLYRSESSVLVAGGGGDVAGAKSRGNYLQESANGDLSSAPGTPTALTLSPGVNTRSLASRNRAIRIGLH